MRSLTGAETFCAIRSYLATASRHGISWLDAPTRAAQGDPWIPQTATHSQHYRNYKIRGTYPVTARLKDDKVISDWDGSAWERTNGETSPLIPNYMLKVFTPQTASLTRYSAGYLLPPWRL
jgi:hypothetical protein